MKIVRAAIILGLLLFCSLLLAPVAAIAQGKPSETILATNPVFRKNCAKCHGKTAAGRHFGGPSLVSGKVSTASDDDLRNIITNGKGRMPSFAVKLTRQEVDELVREIKAQQIKAEPVTTPQNKTPEKE